MGSTILASPTLDPAPIAEAAPAAAAGPASRPPAAAETMTKNRRGRAERAAAKQGTVEQGTTLPAVVTCAVCGAPHARVATRARGERSREVVLMPAHKAAHDGWNTEAKGMCGGSNYPPMELTPQGARDLLERKDATLAALRERLDRLSRSDVHSVTDLKGWWGPRGSVIPMEDPRFARAVQLERTDLDMTCTSLAADIELLKGRLRNWLLGDLARELPAPAVRTGYTRLHRNPVEGLVQEVTVARASVGSLLPRVERP